MKHSEFQIGTEFFTAEGKWRCTDVGTRVIVAISLEPREIVRAQYSESGEGTGHGAANSTEVSTVAQKLTAAQQRALKREAAGWDDLSDEDFTRLFDEGQPVRVRVRRPPPKTLTIVLDERTLNRLKRVARHKQVRARHLVAMWIAEHLSQERPAEK